MKGIECLSPGSFKGVLSNKDRLLKTVPIELYKHSTEFAGFGDENGCGRYQATLLDWDLEFVELTPNKVAIAVAMNMTEKNQQKEKAKEKRVTWDFSPITRVIKNKKAYDRFRDRKDKKIYEEQLELLEEEDDE